MRAATRRLPDSQAPTGPPKTDPPGTDPDVRLQARWTGGSQLATRSASAFLWTALAAGPLALALAVLTFLTVSGDAREIGRASCRERVSYHV